jgi:hypothetical protein
VEAQSRTAPRACGKPLASGTIDVEPTVFANNLRDFARRLVATGMNASAGLELVRLAKAKRRNPAPRSQALVSVVST